MRMLQIFASRVKGNRDNVATMLHGAEFFLRAYSPLWSSRSGNRDSVQPSRKLSQVGNSFFVERLLLIIVTWL